MPKQNWWQTALGLDAGDRPPVARLAAIALIAGSLAAAFVYASGWLSPGRLAPATVADALQSNTGRVFAGFRRAHAKGLCVSGSFSANGQGVALSKASLFRFGSVPVIGRFSTGGGNPFAPDGRVVFHAMALEFRLPDGTQWRTAMDDTPTFPVSTPVAFVALQAATTPDPATGRPDPARLQPFLAMHPETRAFLAWMKQAPLPSSFANSSYNSIDAFRFTNRLGKVSMVRWSLQPEAPAGSVDKSKLQALDANFLFDDFLARVSAGPQRWRMMISLAGAGDDPGDASVAWSPGDPQIEVGTLTLDGAVPEDIAGDGLVGCRDINFDPLVLPAGITASDDPLLPARSAVYAASYQRRAIEGPGQSGMDRLAGVVPTHARAATP